MNFGKLTGDQSYLPQGNQQLQAGIESFGRGRAPRAEQTLIGGYGYGTSYLDKDIQVTGENIENLDWMRGEEQSTWAKVGLGLTKFVGKTAVETAGGLAGWLYGTAAAIGDQSLRSFIDNDFTNAMEDLREGMDRELKLYRSEQEAGSKFGGAANFWFDTFLGGASFLVGAALTELGYSALTAATFGGGAAVQAAGTAALLQRGASVLGRGANAAARLGGTIDKVGKSSRIMSQTPNWMNKLMRSEQAGANAWSGLGYARRAMTAAGYESTIEAKDFLNRAEEEWDTVRRADPTKWTINPETGDMVYIEPTPEERALFRKGIQPTANAAWLANMAVVSQARSIAFGKIFGPGLTGKGLGSVRRAQLLASDKLGQRALGRTWQMGAGTAAVLKGPISEGAEEMLQGAIRETAINYTMSKYDVLGTKDDDWDRFFDTGWGSAIQAAGEEFANTFAMRDWDQVQEGIVGALLGASGLPFNRRAFRRQKVKDPQTGQEKVKLVRDPNESMWSGGIIKAYGDFSRGERNAEDVRKFVETLSPDEIFKFAQTHPDLQASLREMVPAMARMWGKQGELDDALDRGSLKDAKSAEADMMHAFMTAHVRAGLYNQMVKEFKGSLANMSNDDFRATFYADQSLSDDEIEQRKREISTKFERQAKNTRNIVKQVEQILPYRYGQHVDNSVNEYFTYIASVAQNRGERIESIAKDFEQSNPGVDIREWIKLNEDLKVFGRLYGSTDANTSSKAGFLRLTDVIQALSDQDTAPEIYTALNDEANQIKEALWMSDEDFSDLFSAVWRLNNSPLTKTLATYKGLQRTHAGENDLYIFAAENADTLNTLLDLTELQDELLDAADLYNNIKHPHKLAEVKATIEERYNFLADQLNAKAQPAQPAQNPVVPPPPDDDDDDLGDDDSGVDPTDVDPTDNDWADMFAPPDAAGQPQRPQQPPQPPQKPQPPTPPQKPNAKPAPTNKAIPDANNQQESASTNTQADNDYSDDPANFLTQYDPTSEIVELGFHSQKELGEWLKGQVDQKHVEYGKPVQNGVKLQVKVVPVTDQSDPVLQRVKGSMAWVKDMDPKDYHKVLIQVILTRTDDPRIKYRIFYRDIHNDSSSSRVDFLIELWARKTGADPNGVPLYDVVENKLDINTDTVGDKLFIGVDREGKVHRGTILSIDEKANKVPVVALETIEGPILALIPAHSLYEQRPDTDISVILANIAQAEEDFAAGQRTPLSKEQIDRQKQLITEAVEAFNEGRPVIIDAFSLTKGRLMSLRDATGKPINRNVSQVPGLGVSDVDWATANFSDKHTQGENTVVLSVATSRDSDFGTLLTAVGGSPVLQTTGVRSHGQVYMHVRTDPNDPTKSQQVKLNKARLSKPQIVSIIDRLLPSDKFAPDNKDLAFVRHFIHESSTTTKYYWEKGHKSAFYIGRALISGDKLVTDDVEVGATAFQGAKYGIWVRPRGEKWVNIQQLAQLPANKRALLRDDLIEGLSEMPFTFSVDSITWGKSLRELLSPNDGALADHALQGLQPNEEGYYEPLPGIRFTQADVDAGTLWAGLMMRENMIESDMSDDVFGPPFVNLFYGTPSVNKPQPAPSKPAPKADLSDYKTVTDQEAGKVKAWLDAKRVKHTALGTLTRQVFSQNKDFAEQLITAGLITEEGNAFELNEQEWQAFKAQFGIGPKVDAVELGNLVAYKASVAESVKQHEIIHTMLFNLKSKLTPAQRAELNKDLKYFLNLVEDDVALSERVPEVVNNWIAVIKESDNFEEIVTYALTHPIVAKWLNESKIKMPKGYANRKSLWDIFKGIVLKAFGFTVNDDSLLSYLGDILDTYTAIVTSPTDTLDVAETGGLFGTGNLDSIIEQAFGSTGEFDYSMFNNYVPLGDEKGLTHFESTAQMGTTIRSLALLAQQAPRHDTDLVGSSGVSMQKLKDTLKLLATDQSIPTERRVLFEDLVNNWDNGIATAVAYELSKDNLIDASGEYVREEADDFEQMFINDNNLAPDKKMSARLKQFLRTLPQYKFGKNRSLLLVQDPYTGLPVPTNFQRTLPKMYQDLLDSTSPADMMSRIFQLAHKSPFYMALYQKLTKKAVGVNDRDRAIELHNLITELYTHFAMTKINYLSTFYEAGDTKNDESSAYVLDVTSHAAEAAYTKQWGLNLRETDGLVVDNKVSENYTKAVTKDFTSLVNAVLKATDNSTDAVEALISNYVGLLARVGIQVNNEAIHALLEHESAPGTNTPFGDDLAGFKRYLGLAYNKRVIGTRISPQMIFTQAVPTLVGADVKNISSLYKRSAGRAVGALAKYYAELDPVRQHAMIDGVDDKQYYTVSETNTIADLIRMLRNPSTGAAQALLARLKADTWSKDSWILSDENRLAALQLLYDFDFIRLGAKGDNESGKTWSDSQPQEQLISDMIKILGVNGKSVMFGTTPSDKSTRWLMSCGDKLEVGVNFLFNGTMDPSNINWENIGNITPQFGAPVKALFSRYFDTELACIREAILQRKSGVKQPLKGYLEGKNGAEGRGLRFRHFSGIPFNQELYDLIQDDSILRDGGKVIDLNSLFDLTGAEAGLELLNNTVLKDKDALIQGILENRVNKEVAALIEKGIVSKPKSGLAKRLPQFLQIGRGVIPRNIWAMETAAFDANNPTHSSLAGLAQQAMIAYQTVADFALNSAMAMIEYDKLFYGDPAVSKDFKDKIKRAAGPNSTGMKLATYNGTDNYGHTLPAWLSEEFKNFRTNNNLGDDDFLAVECRELQFEHNYEDVYQLLRDGYAEIMWNSDVIKDIDGETKAIIDRAFTAFKEIDVADGIAWCNPEFYKQYLIRSGQYTAEVAKAFDFLLDGGRAVATLFGPEVYNEAVAAAMKVALSPLKMTYNGPRSNQINGVKDENGDTIYPADTVRIFDKPAIFPIFEFMTKAPDGSPTKFAHVYNYMTTGENAKRGVMFKMASATKLASLDSSVQADFNDANTFNGASYKQNYEFIRRQQITEPHHQGEMKMGVQIKRILLGNLQAAVPIISKVAGYSTLKKSQLVKLLAEATNRLSDIGTKEALDSLGVTIDETGHMEINKVKLFNTLRAEAVGSNLGARTIRALNDMAKGENISLSALTESASLQTKVLTAIMKSAVDMVTQGNSFIQEAEYGHDAISYDNALKFNTETGKWECKVSIRMFQSAIPKHLKTFAEQRQFLLDNPEALEMLGYRIPSQSKASAMALQVVDVLPAYVGDVIVFPKEVRAVAGSDLT